MSVRHALIAGVPALLAPWLALGLVVPVFVPSDRGDHDATLLVDPHTGDAEPGPPRPESTYEPDCVVVRPGEDVGWQVHVAHHADACVACVDRPGAACGTLRLTVGGVSRVLGPAPGTERPYAAARVGDTWWVVTGASSATLLGWPDAGEPVRLPLDPSLRGDCWVAARDGFFHVEHDWDADGERGYHVALDGMVTDVGLVRHLDGVGGGGWCGRPAPDGRVQLFGTRHTVAWVVAAPFVGLAGATATAVTSVVGLVLRPRSVGWALLGALIGCCTAPVAVVVYLVATFDPGKLMF